jgi:hypothetical protein
MKTASISGQFLSIVLLEREGNTEQEVGEMWVGGGFHFRVWEVG